MTAAVLARPAALEVQEVRRHSLGDVYLLRTQAGLPLEAYFSGDYSQAGDALRAERYGAPGRIPTSAKAVVKLSVMGGCPFRCRPCDAGLAGYAGDATADEIVAQFDHVIADQGLAACAKLKLHLSKLGEPSLNWAASEDALRRIVAAHPSLNALPTVTVLPRDAAGAERVAAGMLSGGLAPLTQTKVTVGATDEARRRRLFGRVAPVDLVVAALAAQWPRRDADHRVTLSLLAVPGQPIDAVWLLDRIPEAFRPAVTVELYKVNKTRNAVRHGQVGEFQRYRDSGPYEAAMRALEDAGVRTYFSAPSDGEQRALVANGSSLLAAAGREG